LQATIRCSGAPGRPRSSFGINFTCFTCQTNGPRCVSLIRHLVQDCDWSAGVQF
jgi:hypothetical protein